MDDTADRTVVGLRHPASVRPPNCAATRTGSTTPAGCARDGAAPSASTGWPSSPPGCSAHRASQISLLTDVQLVAAGAGLPPGAVGAREPARGLAVHGDRRRDAARSSSPTPGRRARPRPAAGHLRAGRRLPRGIPLTGHGGRVIGALCVFGPEPRDVVGRPTSPRCASWPSRRSPSSSSRPWSASTRRDRRALGPGDRRRRHRHVRLGPDQRPARVGRPADRHVRLRRRRRSTRASRRSTPGCTPTTCSG